MDRESTIDLQFYYLHFLVHGEPPESVICQVQLGGGRRADSRRPQKLL
jgi:hypothetical protein